jgi:heme-degrading monooxygenase HmoA
MPLTRNTLSAGRVAWRGFIPPLVRAPSFIDRTPQGGGRPRVARSGKDAMFAQVVSTEAESDKLAGLLTFCEEQLPGFREVPGFKGFYLLADRQSGKIVTISLWDSDDDLRRNNEGRGAQARQEASTELGVAPPPVDVYEVVLQA